MKRLLLSLPIILVMMAGCLPTGGGETPVVESFDASPGSIASGESSTLSWTVSGATAVSVDQEVGDVALSGTRVVSPTTTTTYTLTASNDAGSATATAQVVVSSGSEAESEAEAETESEEEAETVSEHTVTLHSIPGEDGNVRQGAPGPFTDDVIVGDDQHNKARQASLSFDISGIPAGASIESASLNVNSFDKLGIPFTNLGKLRVYNDQYGTLGPGDFTSGFPGGAMTTYSLSSPPTGPLSNSALISKLQTRVDAGNSRFQVRLQFEKQTDWNGKIDALRLTSLKLVVTYEE